MSCRAQFSPLPRATIRTAISIILVVFIATLFLMSSTTTTPGVSAQPCPALGYHTSPSCQSNQSCMPFNSQCVPNCNSPSSACAANTRYCRVVRASATDAALSYCEPRCDAIASSGACIGSSSCVWYRGKCYPVCATDSGTYNSTLLCEKNPNCMFVPAGANASSSTRDLCLPRCELAIDEYSCGNLIDKGGRRCAWNRDRRRCGVVCSTFDGDEATCNKFSDSSFCRWYASANSGICRYDCSTARFERYCTAHEDCMWVNKMNTQTNQQEETCTISCNRVADEYGDIDPVLCKSSGACVILTDPDDPTYTTCQMRGCGAIVSQTQCRAFAGQCFWQHYNESDSGGGGASSGKCESTCSNRFAASNNTQCLNSTASVEACFVGDGGSTCEPGACSIYSGSESSCLSLGCVPQNKTSSSSSSVTATTTSVCYEPCYKFSGSQTSCDARASYCYWSSTSPIPGVTCLSRCDSAPTRTACATLVGCQWRASACRKDCTLFSAQQALCQGESSCVWTNTTERFLGCHADCRAITSGYDDCVLTSFCTWNAATCTCVPTCGRRGSAATTTAGGACTSDSLICSYSQDFSSCLYSSSYHGGAGSCANAARGGPTPAPPLSTGGSSSGSAAVLGGVVGAVCVCVIIVVVVLYMKEKNVDGDDAELGSAGGGGGGAGGAGGVGGVGGDAPQTRYHEMQVDSQTAGDLAGRGIQ